jgi:transposase
MFNNIVFTKALGLQDPWRVDKVEFDADRGRLDLYISRKRGSKHPCPECGVKCRIQQYFLFFQPLPMIYLYYSARFGRA